MSYKKAITAVFSIAVAFSAMIFPQKITPDRNYILTADSAFKTERLYNQWNYKWELITFNKYASTANSLRTSGCGIFAFCNALYALNGNVSDPVEVATWAVDIGGLQPGNGGTYRIPFFNNVQSAFGNKLGFSVYGYTDGRITDSRLVTHLMNGGVAVVNVPGHFMAVTGYNPVNNTYHVIESAVSATRGLPPDSWVSAEKMSSGNTAVSWYALLGNSGTANRTPTAPENQGYKLENFGDCFYARIKNPSTDRYFTNNDGILCGDKADISNSQIWKFQLQSDCSYRISSMWDGDFMGLSSNGDVYLSEGNTGNSQKFYIYSLSGKYYIKPVNSDLFINMSAGLGNIAVSINPADLPPQEFDIIKVDMEEALPTNIGNNFYAKIKNSTDEYDLYLKDNGGNVIADTADYNGNAQLWNFRLQSDGSYKIVNCKDKSCISVADYDNARDGANLQTAEDNGGENSQKYYLYNVYGGFYIRSFGSDLFVNVNSVENADVAGYVTNWTAQKFYIERVIKGDLNGDEKVNSEDAVMLNEWLSGKEISIDLQTADLNDDGCVDSFDLTLFRQFAVEARIADIKKSLIDAYINHRTE